MRNYLTIYIVSFLVSFFAAKQINAQAAIANNDFLLQNFILSLESGINYGFTDYKTSNIEPGIRGSIEYFPIIINNARLGLKLFGGGTSLSFSDGRGSIQNNDEPNPREIPLDICTDIIQIGGSINFGLSLNESLISYLNVGAAYLIFSPKNSDGKILTFNSLKKYDKEIISIVLEGGLRYKLSDRFGLNFALSYYPTSTDYLDDISAAKSKDSFLSGLIGLSFALSSSPDSDNDGVPDNVDQCPNTPPGIKIDAFGCPLDSDNDGVLDYLDKCNDTPKNVSVDLYGCPVDTDKDGVPDYLDKCPETPVTLSVDNFGCPEDSDNDGILDSIDQCLNTPTGVMVDSKGCPVDSDADSVPDYLDKCADTPQNSKVDSTGCPEGTAETFYQFILRGNDTFESNTATLKEMAKILLSEIVNYMKSQPGSKWRIEGYMDNQGSTYLLKKLSYDRAKTIYEYLISQGLSADRFSVYGLGSSSPIANNDTAEGRSTNKRIIIIRED